MNSLEKIRSYINNTQIRKVLWGGYDREDVYMKMNELVDVFREYVKEEIENQELERRKAEMQLQQKKVELEEYERKLRDSQSVVVELHKKLDNLTSVQIETEKEMYEMKDAYKKYCTNILEQYSGSLKTLSAEFSKILDNISMLQQNIVEMDDIENIEMPKELLGEKAAIEFSDLGIDMDEWLREDEDMKTE